MCFECFLERKDALLNAKVKNPTGQAFLLIHQGYTPKEAAARLDMPVADVIEAVCQITRQLSQQSECKSPWFGGGVCNLYDKEDMIQEVLLASQEGKSEKEIKRIIWRLQKRNTRYRQRTKRLVGEIGTDSGEDIQTIIEELTG